MIVVGIFWVGGWNRVALDLHGFSLFAHLASTL